MFSNESLFFIAMGVDLGLALLIVRYFGKLGLYGLIVFNIILCNIQVFKIINLFGYDLTLGNVAYGSIFLATDLLSEVYGAKEARKAVYFGFAMLIFFAVSMQLTLLFTPNPQDIISADLNRVFQWTPRLTLASLLAFGFSQSFDVWLFHWAKTKTKGKHLWLRNNLSTMSSQFLDTVIFTSIAFAGMVEHSVLVILGLTTLVVKWSVALLDTPFVYLGRRWLLKRHVEETAHSGSQPMHVLS